MMTISVDLNCDMGEGMENDAAIMPYITSANIACGYHAGDEETMQQTVMLAQQYGVKIGAHPSFLDRENFGRTNCDLPFETLYDLVQKQIELLLKITSRNNAQLHHVKPHGALYNQASKDEVVATAICKAVLSVNPSLLLYAQSGSVLIRVAQAMGIQTVSEVFADRTYQRNGLLTPRTASNALLHDSAEVANHVLQMVTHQSVLVNGEVIHVKADTVCIHGDGSQALAFVMQIRDVLLSKNIKIQAI